MPEGDENFYAGHRERLREKFLNNQLTDYEKLELLLSYAIPRRDVRSLARGLVKQFGGVYQVLCASVDDLIAFKGIGRNTAIFLKVVQQMMQIGYMGQLKETPVFHDEKILHNYCRVILSGKQVEELHVLYLGVDLKLLEDEKHTSGTIDSSAIYPREIARRALQLNARSVVLVHNHPISENAFSQDDVDITEMVKNVLSPLQIMVYDHLLVVNDTVYSMRALHYMM